MSEFTYEVANEKLNELKKFLEPSEIEWKIQSKTKGNNPVTIIVPYLDSRACYDRMDSAFGARWSCSVREVQYKEEVVVKKGDFTKKIPEVKEVKDRTGFIYTFIVQGDGFVIKREDGAPVTDIEAFKGGISSSAKRCAHLFNIGRELYSYPKIQIIGEHKWIPKEVISKLNMITEKFIKNGAVDDNNGYPIKLDGYGKVV